MMIRTKLVGRIVKDQLKRANQRRPHPKRPRSGVKNTEGRIRNRDIKNKQLIPQPKPFRSRKVGKLLGEW